MDSETNHNMKVVSCGSKSTMWSFQNIFNTLFIIFLILSSVGLWACLVEINKLKQSTSSLLETISLIKDVPVYEKLHDVNGVYMDMLNDIQHDKNNAKTDYETYNKDNRHIDKRAAVPISEAYDPLSPAPHKDLTEYCVTLLSQKCGSYLPGAPAVGPPGPPGPPGEQGRQGIMGHQGPPGLNGQKGQKGEKGDTGRVGEPGADGPKGPPGFPGVNGIQGSNGRRGKRGLQGRPGRPGDDGIPGAPGQKGNKGEPGDPGGTVNMKGGNCSCDRAKGQKGERGHIGFYGYKGNKGIGIKGDKGQRGLLGFTGYKGDKGEAGHKGDKGYGMQGFPGPRGPQGKKGEKGDAGFCIASRCGDKYVRRKVTEPGVDSYTVKSETTTEMTTTTTTLPPTTTLSTVPPSIEPRSTVCRIKRIGTPVYIKREEYAYGAILSDPLMPDSFWVTEGYHGQFLYKFNSMDRLKKKLVDSKYNLQINRFFGTQHAIYNNSFYYQFNGKQHVVRYDLSINDVVTAIPILDSHFNDSKYLYKDSKIYYDITADENGLWIIYGRPRPIGGESYIHVIKADPVTMKIIRKWRLPKKIGVYKNGFIACGIFYLMKDLEPDQTETEIDFAYDFYSDEENDVKIKIKIPFGSTNMLTFYTNTPDRRKSVLMAWDNGNIIKYPLLF